MEIFSLLNSKTCNLLNTLSSISNTCILRYPCTIINDESKSIIAKVDLSDYESDFEPIGLNNKINNLTSIISMMSDPEVERVDNILCIRDNSNKIESKFVTDSIELLSSTEFKIETFERVLNAVTVSEFKLTTDDIARFKTAHSVYAELSDVIFEYKDGVCISLGAQNKFNRSDNCFSITKDVESTKNFKCSINFDVLQRIPKVDYNVCVKYSEKTTTYALVLTSETIKTSIVLSTLVR